MAEAVAGSAGGAKISLANAFGDLKEEIGSLIADQVKPAQGALTEFFRIVANGLADAKNLKEALAGGKGADYESAIASQNKYIKGLEKALETAKKVEGAGQIAAREADIVLEKNKLKGIEARQRGQQEAAGKERAATAATNENTEAVEANAKALAAMDEWDMASSAEAWAEASMIAATALGNVKTNLESIYDLSEGEKSPFVGMTEEMRLAIEESNKLAESQKNMFDVARAGASMVTDTFAALGEAIGSGEDPAKAFFKTLISSIGDAIIAFGSLAEAQAWATWPIVDIPKAMKGSAIIAGGAVVKSSAYAMAEGGVVMPTPGGTLARIGEAGRPEAVIPLDRMGGMGGGVTQIFNIGGSVIAERQVKSLAMSGMAQAARGY